MFCKTDLEVVFFIKRCVRFSSFVSLKRMHRISLKLKMMKRKTYVSAFAALLLAFGFAGCTSEEFYDAQDEGGVVSMTVGIRKAGVFDGDTRTSLSETETGDLKCVWESDDRIMVSDAKGDIKGYLSLTDGDGTNFAHFHSDNLERITADTQNLNFVYLGRGKKQSDLDNSAQYKYISLFYNNQTGTMESLSDKDILVKTGVSVSVSDGKVYTADGNDVIMTRPFAFGHFTLAFPDGVSRTNETVTITAPEGGDDGIRCAVNLHYNGQIGIGNNSKGISVNGQTGNDLYITIPMQDNSTVTPTFTVTINGKEYTGSLPERRWSANEYVRKGVREGVLVNMNTDEQVVDDRIFGLHWTESNVASWMDHNSSYNDWYLYSYIPGIPFVEQNIRPMRYTSKTTLEVSDNPYIFFFQWDRDFGFVASDADYDSQGCTTWVPNAEQDWYYEVLERQLSSIDDYENFDKMVYLGTNKPLDWCSVKGRFNWDRRQNTLGLSAQPEGFRIPSGEEYEKLVPENSGTSYSYSRSFIWNDQTYYPFFAKTEEEATYVWYYMKSGSSNYLSIHKLKGSYTKDNVNSIAINNDCVGYVDFKLTGYTLAGGLSKYGSQAFYWASDSKREGYANSFGIVLDTSRKTIELQYKELPRTYGLVVRCVYDD